LLAEIPTPIDVTSEELDMAHVLADPQLKDALTRNGDQVEVRDEAGHTIGFVVTTTEMEKIQQLKKFSADVYAQADRLFDPEAMRRTMADPQRYSMDEVLKLVESD
jgi:hypothetical protein